MVRKPSDPIGELITKYRNKAGLTQLELSKKLGYTNSVFICQIETGTSKVPFNTLGAIIELLKISQKEITEILMKMYFEKVTTEINEGREKQRALMKNN